MKSSDKPHIEATPTDSKADRKLPFWLRQSMTYVMLTAASAGSVMLLTGRNVLPTASEFAYETLQYESVQLRGDQSSQSVEPSTSVPSAVTDEPYLLSQATGTERLIGGCELYCFCRRARWPFRGSD